MPRAYGGPGLGLWHRLCQGAEPPPGPEPRCRAAGWKPPGPAEPPPAPPHSAGGRPALPGPVPALTCRRAPLGRCSPPPSPACRQSPQAVAGAGPEQQGRCRPHRRAPRLPHRPGRGCVARGSHRPIRRGSAPALPFPRGSGVGAAPAVPQGCCAGAGEAPPLRDSDALRFLFYRRESPALRAGLAPQRVPKHAAPREAARRREGRSCAMAALAGTGTSSPKCGTAVSAAPGPPPPLGVQAVRSLVPLKPVGAQTPLLTSMAGSHCHPPPRRVPLGPQQSPGPGSLRPSALAGAFRVPPAALLPGT